MRRSREWKVLLGCIALGGLAFAGFGCDVDYEEGEMPEVEMTEGEMPEVDVDAPEIDVETEPIEVPTDIDIDPAEEYEEEEDDPVDG
ncbi:MAG: hypothetical protein ACF8PN_03650 [Phycisphaerales bacterium]